jgi:ubiquinone/menaquinone biosynthesis C-methylase UbiE
MRHLHHHRAGTRSDGRPVTRGRMIRWATFYDPFVSLFTLGRRARLRRATVALAEIQPGEQVLEVGCGTGDVALAASAQAGAVVGIDPAPEMIAVARAKAARLAPAVDFQVGVIEALPFPDAAFDVVLSSLMMHHLPDDLKREGIAEIARVLKPGGRLVIVDMKHPTGRRSRMLASLAMHGQLASGIQDLPALLWQAGLAQVESGDTPFRLLGFVRAQTRR